MAIYNNRVKINRDQVFCQRERPPSILNYIYGVFRFIIIIIQNLYCVSSYLVLSWIVLIPVGWLRVDLYSKLENYLYNLLLYIVSSWSLAAGTKIVEAGDEFKHLIEQPDIEQVRHSPKQNNDLISNCKCSLNNKTTKNKQKLKDCNNQSDDLTNLKKFIKNDLNDTNRYNENFTAPIEVLKNNNNSGNNNKNEAASKSRTKSYNYKITEYIQAKNSANRAISTLSDDLLLKSNHKAPRILLLCNHISTADVPLIMQSFSTLTNQSLLWVLDAQFKYTNFGVVCSSHGDFFVAKNAFQDGSLREQVLKYPDRNLLVLFPEGGFLRKRIEGSNRYATRNGFPLTKYVTHPRFGAFKDLIDPSVGVTHIVDATLMYDDIENPVSIIDIAMGTRKESAILKYKVYKRSDIDPTEEWLRNIWLEKDKLLKEFYENRPIAQGQFAENLTTIELNWFKIISVHLFYLLVCYLVIYRLFSATSLTMLKARDLYYSDI